MGNSQAQPTTADYKYRDKSYQPPSHDEIVSSLENQFIRNEHHFWKNEFEKVLRETNDLLGETSKDDDALNLAERGVAIRVGPIFGAPGKDDLRCASVTARHSPPS